MGDTVLDALIAHSGTINSFELNPPTEVPDRPTADAVRRALPPDIAWRGMGTDAEDTEIQNAIMAGWMLAEGRTRQIWSERTIDVAWSGWYYVPPYWAPEITISEIEFWDSDTSAFLEAPTAWSMNGKRIFELHDDYLKHCDWKFRLSYPKRVAPQGVQLAVASLAAWELSTGVHGHDPHPAPNTPESNLAANAALASSPILRGDPFRATSAGQLLRWYEK